MHPFLNRRNFFAHTATGLGGIALAHLLGGDRALLSKPFDAATLREVVAQTLATR